jgi:MFS family permease
MSFADHAVLWLHVTAAVFTIGPGTAAIMSTPRFVRKRNAAVVGFLFRTTRIYSFAALLTLIFGLILTEMTHKFSQWWISVSLTLFVFAFVLLLLVIIDQRKALAALERADRDEAAERADQAKSIAVAVIEAANRSEAGQETPAEPGQPAAAQPAAAQPAATVGRNLGVAAVERGRIRLMGGLTALIWLVILVLMAWH